jgi:hypothetical protein
MQPIYQIFRFVVFPSLIIAINPFLNFRRRSGIDNAKRFDHGLLGLEERFVSVVVGEDLSAVEQSAIPSTTVPATTLAAAVSAGASDRASGGSIITIVTPSPGAQPITITSQGELVTTWSPYYSLCPLVRSGSTPPFSNSSPKSTASSWDPSDCSTAYTPIVTPICNTVLTGFATFATITNCSQSLTFSSDVSFSLQSGVATSVSGGVFTASPWVQAITTFYIALWSELTSGAVPSTVEAAACSADSEGASTTCVDSMETWAVSNVTITQNTLMHVTIAQTIQGPSALLVETLRTDITGVNTFVSVDMTIVGSTPFATQTIVRSSLPSSTAASSEEQASTMYTTITRTVTYLEGVSALPSLSGNPLESAVASGAPSGEAEEGQNAMPTSPSAGTNDEPSSAPSSHIPESNPEEPAVSSEVSTVAGSLSGPGPALPSPTISPEPPSLSVPGLSGGASQFFGGGAPASSSPEVEQSLTSQPGPVESSENDPAATGSPAAQR